MWNIIKAQNYQLKSDNIVIYCFLFCLVFEMLFTSLFSNIDSLSDMTGSLFLAGSGEVIPFFIAVMSLVLTTRICGWDMNDKTINYEVLSGHKRSEVFWGRVITSIIWSMAGCVIVVGLPVIAFSVINGWGNSMSLKGACFHLVLVFFPVFRIICEFVLLTFILSNCFSSLVVGWTLYEAVTIITLLMEDALDIEISFQLGSTNISKLLYFGNYSTGYIDGKDVTVYATALDNKMIAGTILASLIFGAMCLIIGFVYFRKKDIS